MDLKVEHGTVRLVIRNSQCLYECRFIINSHLKETSGFVHCLIAGLYDNIFPISASLLMS